MPEEYESGILAATCALFACPVFLVSERLFNISSLEAIGSKFLPQQHVAAPATFEPTASEKVLLAQSSELLEHILVHLPVKDILVSRGVCRRFRDCYDGSTTQLKIKTFETVHKVFTAAELAAIPPLPPGPFAYPRINSLLLSAHPQVLAQSRLKGIPGIKEAYLHFRRDRRPALGIWFDDIASWRREYVGSWTRQYLTEPAYPVDIIITVSLETKRKTSTGDVVHAKHGMLIVPFPAATIGETIAAAQDLHEIVVANFGRLPAKSVDLADDLQIPWAANRFGPIVCNVSSVRHVRRLN